MKITKYSFKNFYKRPSKRMFIILLKAIFIDVTIFVISIITFQKIPIDEN